MEGTMKSGESPQTDSIRELARSWDTLDLTDFTKELEDVSEPVFGRRSVIPNRLEAAEANAEMLPAKANRLAEAGRIREGVLE
jgi:hypothetical protein